MSQSTRKNSTRSKRITVEISVIVALIGFAATVTASLINYCSSRYPIEQSMKATQKADQNLSRAALTLTQPLPPTEPLPPTPVWTATSEPTPSPTAAQAIADWRSLFDIQASWYPCEYRMIPSYIDMKAGTENAAAKIEAALTTGEFHKWDLGPEEKSFILTMEIYNISQDVDWLRLSKSASVLVQSVSEVPEQIAMAATWGCGGGGMFRDFSVGSLASTYKSYQLEVTYPDPEVDFFTLKQGEFESFIFTFECSAPGIYHLEIHIPFSQKGVEGEIVYADPQRLVCPVEYSGYEYISSFDNLSGVADLRFEGTFTWNGTEYVVKP